MTTAEMTTDEATALPAVGSPLDPTVRQRCNFGERTVTTTDRELLEAAARAEGHGVEFDELSGLTFMDSKLTGVLWNPLHCDGDALRLAVKLGLIVDAGAHRASDGMGSWSGQAGERDGYAATRRAIVRAAAALAGK